MGQKINELGNVEKKNQEYENKIILATQEIERLNRVLRERNNELNDYQSMLQDYELKLQRMESDLKDTKRRYDQEAAMKNQLESEMMTMQKKLGEMK